MGLCSVASKCAEFVTTAEVDQYRAEGLPIERKTDAMSDDGRLLMCPENLHEGMRLGPIHYVVMPEQARAFANAVGAQSRDFIPDAETGDAIVSPTMRLQDY